MKWEYKKITTQYGILTDQEMALEGEQEWEHYLKDGSVNYFKREKKAYPESVVRQAHHDNEIGDREAPSVSSGQDVGVRQDDKKSKKGNGKKK